MTIDWADSLKATHDLIGVSAKLSKDSWSADVTAIDQTSGVALQSPADAEVQTVVPAAVVQMAELAAKSLTRADVEGATLEINGATWKVEDTLPRPTPKGEADGELLLVLSEIAS